MATQSSVLAWKIPWMEEPGRLIVHGIAKSWTRLSNFTFTLNAKELMKLKKIFFKYLFVYLAALGLSSGTQDLRCVT